GCSTFTEAAKKFGSTFRELLGTSSSHIQGTMAGMRQQERFTDVFRGIQGSHLDAMFKDGGRYAGALYNNRASLTMQNSLGAGKRLASKIRPDYAGSMGMSAGIGMGM